ncbi:MAG TPA: hypothetical protein VN775_12260 [Opitutaceae bacterium]|nr:hypothetical protein [Opitutaceae bacterium]
MGFQRGSVAQASWVLRIGVAMEFIGHGALGFLHPAAWFPYFAVMGIPREAAASLMPLVGSLDLALALVALFHPLPGAVLYMALWGLGTALLRPLAGEPAWEALERSGNFGAALALFLMARREGASSWLRFRGFGALDEGSRSRVCWVLRLTTAGILLGHGALGLLVRKALLSTQYASIGLQGAWVEPCIGAFECALAVAVLVWPGFGLLIFVAAWKLATEALSPMAGSPIWVFVEHGGSYAAPLALALMDRSARATALETFRESPARRAPERLSNEPRPAQ